VLIGDDLGDESSRDLDTLSSIAIFLSHKGAHNQTQSLNHRNVDQEVTNTQIKIARTQDGEEVTESVTVAWTKVTQSFTNEKVTNKR
jgi:hypothetical protein